MKKEMKIALAKMIIGTTLFISGYITGIIWLYIGAYIFAAYETVFEALRGLLGGNMLDENFLMTIASIGAIYCGQYPEAVAVMLFYQIGEFFEDYAIDNSRKSISNLMDIKPEFANKLLNGKEFKVAPKNLELNDIIIVKPGEKIPIDGIVLEGFSSLDTSALTGESMPRDVSPNQNIISGTINLSGVLKIKVSKLYEDSTVAKVLDLVENSRSKKASVEKFITKFANYYTPIVVGIAVLLATLPPLLITGETFSDWLYRAMVFLVISCPCALVISVPLSMFAGIGAASRQGILVKGGNYLEALSKVDIFAFDKTGTLTTGEFTVTSIKCTSHKLNSNQLLEIAAYGESMSNHPIALSIVSYFEKSNNKINVNRIKNYKEIPGKGISAELDNEKIFCGNEKLITDLNLKFTEPIEIGSVVHVAKENEYLGYVILADVLRPDSKKMISDLSSLGINQTFLLTGDRKEIADIIASEAGIQTSFSELLPEDKVEILEKILNTNKKSQLAFVGDGINDAPVLARANVGIAMGAFGSDAAVEAADVVIMTDDISRLATMIKIARKTLSIAKQNVIFALSIKGLVLILGALGFATMWAAVFADVGVTLIAILNSMRALKL